MARTISTVVIALLPAVTFSLHDPQAIAPARPSSPAQDGSDAERCQALMRVDFGSLPDAPTRITSARLVDVAPADPKLPPTAPTALLAASPVKQYCQVLGYVASQNKFELRLPLTAQWNSRFYLTACAGSCGVLNGNACNFSLARGYASITGNGGHDSPLWDDGVWAANSPSLQEDFAWRHNHVITVAGKAITTRFYGKPIARSYMTGCSKGGQAVLMEAQRFPADFDGLLPIAPVYDIVGRLVIAGAWWAQAVKGDGRASILTDDVARTVHASVLARCGGQAGVEENVVAEPTSCDWRPEQIACPSGGGGSTCLTPAQVDAVKRMMAPVVDSKGQVVYKYTDIPGTATDWGFHHYPLGGGPDGPTFNYTVHNMFIRFLADPTVRASSDPLTFDFDKGPATLARARALYNADSFDLSAFKARGGKMLMWHGLSDANIIATSSIAYYEGVERLMGGRAQTQDFFRLFLVPGVHHCQDGPGFTQFDAPTLLENWVERGQAPDVMIASRVVNGVTERSRPIYPFPLVARYAGKGDPKEASSFVAHEPRR